MHLEGDRHDEQRGKKKKNESGGKNLGSTPNGRCGGWVWRVVTFDGGDGGEGGVHGGSACAGSSMRVLAALFFVRDTILTF